MNDSSGSPGRLSSPTRPSSAHALRTLGRWVLISRPALWVNTLGPATLALWLSGRLWSTDPAWLVLLLWLTLPFNLLIYGVNDLADRDEDALNPRKGGYQGARLEHGEALPLARAIAALNIPFALYFLLETPVSFWAVVFLYTLLFLGYSLPPLRFKTRPFLDSLSNAAYALPLAFVPLLFGAIPSTLALPCLMAWSVGKHAFDAVQDLETDAAAGVSTVATVLGAANTALWCGAWYLLSSVLAVFLHPLVGLAILLVSGGLTLKLWREPTPARAARLYPLSILSPWAVGMVSGVLLVAHLVRG